MFLSTPYSTLFPYTTLFRSMFCMLISYWLLMRKAAAIVSPTIINFILSFVLLSIATLIRPGTAFLIPFYLLFVFRKRGLRSEEHTSELQSLRHIVCRLLLEK